MRLKILTDTDTTNMHQQIVRESKRRHRSMERESGMYVPLLEWRKPGNCRRGQRETNIHTDRNGRNMGHRNVRESKRRQ